ncbi:hypothetical protein JKA74_05430 [Marivirga sp. S37H4]|uniref:DUF4595 domain-containing protein n=1 Tax=Marivirga aurantiaca TaxID=2802615 RepID=A0A934WX02_9BACT|nr:hypothetical protein [Marivirga aurantiaca]MBK6264471.1 hypothetical protein [Marivirga aurantiaca]
MKIQLFPIALFTLLVVGCNEDPEPVAPIDDSTDLACQVLTISSNFEYEDEYNSSEGSISIVFSYNSDKTISKLNSNFEEFYCYMNNGVEECENYESIEEYSFIYSNGLITDVTVAEDEEGETDLIEFTYSNNKLSKIKFSEEGDTDLDEYVFIYDNDGKLEKLENWDNYSGPTDALVLYGYDEFLWTGDNVTTINSYYDDFEESSSRISNQKNKSIFGIRALKKTSGKNHQQKRFVPELSNKLTLTYDSKSNPLFGNLPFLLWDGEFYTYLSANNPITTTEIEYTDGGQNEDFDSYSYTYNENGFPTVTTNDGDDTLLTYSCE